METTSANRETWLNNLATRMAPKFEELGYPIPPFRVSIGFTSGGRGSNANGECWHRSKSADQRYEVLITPDQHEPLQVAAILAHELCHAAAGFKHKHKGEFAKLMKALGMTGKMTQSVPGHEFAAYVQPHLDELGALPHAQLMFRQRGLAEIIGKALDQDGEGEGADDDEGGSSNAKKKQSTRLLKCSCQNEGCGYTVRITRKWLDELGAPHCPMHGEMASAE